MKRNWWMQVALVAVMLALLVPSAVAGKGGNGKGGGGNGGGGGEDPAPTCSGHVYTLWQVFDGIASDENGMARVCLDGADGEFLTPDTLNWDGGLEVSPDGSHVLSTGWNGAMVSLDDPATVLAFTGESGALPLGNEPSFSWRVDGITGESLGMADQYVAATRDDPIEIPEYGSTWQSRDLWAFHPVSGAQAIRLTTLPRSKTLTEKDVLDQDNNEVVPGVEVNVVHTMVRSVTWLAGTAANPEVSWIVFWQQTLDETWEVVEDPTGDRFWQTGRVETTGWKAMAVQTSSAGVSVLHAPQDLIASGDLASVDIRERNLRFSKFGTHALWEYAQDSGMRRAALAYSTSDATEPPSIDASTIEDIDAGLYTELGSVQFGNNIGLSHDGSRLAVAFGEVWTMDVDAGASSLTQISETIRKRKPGYTTVAWDQ